MAKGIRVNQLAKELNVETKAILAWCRDQGLGDKVPNHMSVLSMRLADEIRNEFAGRSVPAETSSHRPDHPDWYDPSLQNVPEVTAILDFLHNLSPRFSSIKTALTEAQWTAFRALAEKGAVEGIIYLSFTDAAGRAKVEQYWVRGDYPSAMPRAANIRRDSPVELKLMESRLTGTGERWAAYLRDESSPPQKRRGIVLSLLWHEPKQKGYAEMKTPMGATKAPVVKVQSPASTPVATVRGAQGSPQIVQHHYHHHHHGDSFFSHGDQSIAQGDSGIAGSRVTVSPSAEKKPHWLTKAVVTRIIAVAGSLLLMAAIWYLSQKGFRVK